MGVLMPNPPVRSGFDDDVYILRKEISDLAYKLADCELPETDAKNARAELEQRLDKIKAMIKRAPGVVSLLIPDSCVDASGARTLIQAYLHPRGRNETIKDSFVRIPNGYVTGAETLLEDDHEPVLSLRVQTSADAPPSICEGSDEGCEAPNAGSWYRFPLLAVGIMVEKCGGKRANPTFSMIIPPDSRYL